MIDDPAIGTVRGPNLTSGAGGRVEGYTMRDWDRVVRHGVLPDGKPALMPSQDFFQMADEELLDIVAYVRSRPPVDAEVPRPALGLGGLVLVATGQLALSAEAGAATTQHRARPPEAADTVEFGAHVAATCVGCHRPGFEGGPMPFGPPDWPEAANLTPHASGLSEWTFEEFDRALTQGVTRDGRELAEPMSEIIAGTRAMLPIERRALWTYLQSLPPTPMGR
jgi:mono/diheme cytochrome c family protein